LLQWSPASGAVIVGSLGSYLRYRGSLGDDVTALLPVLASSGAWPAYRNVHSLYVNEDFLRRTQARLSAQGFSANFSSHHLTGGDIPLDDQSMDRLVTKNVMVYVDDPARTFTEFRRIIRPGGRVHVTDSDFLISALDQVPALDWRAFIDAAAPAFRTHLLQDSIRWVCDAMDKRQIMCDAWDNENSAVAKRLRGDCSRSWLSKLATLGVVCPDGRP
jgi:SAM-dependent methyltransferase